MRSTATWKGCIAINGQLKGTINVLMGLLSPVVLCIEEKIRADDGHADGDSQQNQEN